MLQTLNIIELPMWMTLCDRKMHSSGFLCYSTKFVFNCFFIHNDRGFILIILLKIHLHSIRVVYYTYIHSLYKTRAHSMKISIIIWKYILVRYLESLANKKHFEHSCKDQILALWKYLSWIRFKSLLQKNCQIFNFTYLSSMKNRFLIRNALKVKM